MGIVGGQRLIWDLEIDDERVEGKLLWLGEEQQQVELRLNQMGYC